jgi:hypothetical protein
MKNQILETKYAAAMALLAIVLAFAAPAMAQFGYPGSTPGTVVAVQPLTADEAQWLKFLREEEKLARDVYQQLYQKWNLTVFQNISASEQTHFSVIGTLLSRYGAEDPAQTTAAGIYSDPNLIALYNELVAKGLRSAQDALEVGVLIEKKDIADLETALKGTSKLDIKRVYTNLLNGSFNHLEAFETICEVVNTVGVAI